MLVDVPIILSARILHPSNIDKEKLMEYAKNAALFATERKSKKLPHTEWSMLPRGKPKFRTLI